MNKQFTKNCLYDAAKSGYLCIISNDKTKQNKTPAKAFTPPAEKQKGHKVVFRQKSKPVAGLYLKAPNPHSFAMESVKICHFKTFRVGNFALRTFCCFFLHYIHCEDISVEYEFKSVKFKGVIDRH